MPTKAFAARASMKRASPNPTFAPQRAISKTTSPSVPPFSGLRFLSSPTPASCSPALWAPPSPPTGSPLPTASLWRSLPPSTVFSVCYSPSVSRASTSAKVGRSSRLDDLLIRHLLFLTVFLLCMLPTLLTRYVIYGSPFESGYIPLRDWLWRSPAFLAVLFSSNHGLLSWTPILLFAIAGLILFRWREPRAGAPFLAAMLAFYLFIACYPDWAGISSFGNRFFVSLTALFILGLAVFLDRAAQLFRSSRAALAAASAFLALFVFWNIGLMFQWGSHLIPARGPVPFSEVIHNQFFVVPRQLAADLHTYLFKRKALMQQIEDRDLRQLEQTPPLP